MFRAAVFAVLLVSLSLTAQDKPQPAPEPKPVLPGPTKDGFLLPNGWHLTPVGKHVEISDLPLNIVPLKDGKHALVTTNGFNRHELSLVDLKEGKVLAAEWARQSWFGFALNKAEDRIWWAGGGNGFLHTFELKDGKFNRTSKKEINPGSLSPLDILKLADELKENKVFKSGLCLDEERGVLYTLDINGGTITAVKLKPTPDEKPVVGTLGGRPYDVVVGKGGHLLYVSDWAKKQVLAVDPVELRVVAKIAVGDHPNQIAAHPKDGRLFVAWNQMSCVAGSSGGSP